VAARCPRPRLHGCGCARCCGRRGGCACCGRRLPHRRHVRARPRHAQHRQQPAVPAAGRAARHHRAERLAVGAGAARRARRRGRAARRRPAAPARIEYTVHNGKRRLPSHGILDPRASGAEPEGAGARRRPAMWYSAPRSCVDARAGRAVRGARMLTCAARAACYPLRGRGAGDVVSVRPVQQGARRSCCRARWWSGRARTGRCGRRGPAAGARGSAAGAGAAAGASAATTAACGSTGRRRPARHPLAQHGPARRAHHCGSTTACRRRVLDRAGHRAPDAAGEAAVEIAAALVVAAAARGDRFGLAAGTRASRPATATGASRPRWTCSRRCTAAAGGGAPRRRPRHVVRARHGPWRR
jgi:hypothetical protein